jgi:hypothetical protein
MAKGLISKSMDPPLAYTRQSVRYKTRLYYMFRIANRSFTLLSSSDILYYLMNKEIGT